MDAKNAPDRALAALAAKQYGVVSLEQLLAAGLGRGAIAHRVRAGRLNPVYRGVHAVGHRRLCREGWWLAAVMACGTGARLSHHAAGAHWDLRPAAAGTVDVTVPSRAGRKRRSGIRVHRPRAFHEIDGTVHDGISVTTVPLTLIELGERIGPAAHARAVERAELLGLFDLSAMQDALAGIPAPAVNTSVERFEVDFLWRKQRLVAETDGLQHHGTRAAFERDRLRDAQLMLGGYRVVRFTYRQVRDEPARVAEVLRGLLAAPSAHMLAR